MKKRIGSGFERLEDRKMCAGVFLAGHVLRIEGTPDRDVAYVSYAPPTEHTPSGTVNATLNGATAQFDRSQVGKIFADMGNGNDYFRADVDVDVEAFGGAGMDRIVTGTGNDTIHGGSQLDSVWGRAGRDRYDMGDGEKDRIFWFNRRYDAFVSNDAFRLPARNWWLDHENVEAFQGRNIVIRRDRSLDAQYPGRVFFYADIDGNVAVTGLHQISNKIRVFHPVGTSVRYIDMQDAIARGIVEDVTVS